MIVTLSQIIVLLPIVIVGLTVIIIMLSIAYNRKPSIHAILSIIGLIISIIVIIVIWGDQKIQNVFQLIYIDNFVILYSILGLVSSVVSSIMAYKWLLNYSGYCDEFYLLLLISSIGSIVLIASNHLMLLFLGIELITLPLFGLISYSDKQKIALEANIKYVILSGVSSSFVLFGIALIYAETGYLSFTGISNVLLDNVICNFMLLNMGLGMMMIGLFVKLSCVPFHLWTPDVYQGAPSPVSMYLATGVKIAIISALIRFLMIFPNQYNHFFCIFLSIIACSSILIGNLMAVYQNNIKRILAYSSIASMGYLLIGVIALRLNSLLALETIAIYLINYLFSSIGVFSVINLMSTACANKDADSLCVYRGLFWYKPILSVMFTVIVFSFAGVPLTLGFISKFYLFVLGINSQLWWPVFFMMIGSVIGIFYYLRIVIGLYLSPSYRLSQYLDAISFSSWMITPSGILIISVSIFLLCLGLYPRPIIYFVQLIH